MSSKTGMIGEGNVTNTQEVNKQDLELQRSIAASDMYQILSISLQLPSDDFVVGLLDGRWGSDVVNIFEELDIPMDKIEKMKEKMILLKGDENSKNVLLTEMRQEYFRLFSHPSNPAIPIYETMFRYKFECTGESSPSLFIDPLTLDVERCYKKAGLVTSKQVNEPADHMATEMEFMMYLYLQKAQGLQQNNQQNLAKIEGEIKEFSELHLQKWAKEFFNLCISCSQNDVYRTIGEIGSMYMTWMLAE